MKALEDVVAELLSKVIDYRADYERNEFEVRQHLINPLLDALGWLSSDPKRVRHNYSTEDRDIPDYVLLNSGKCVLIVEAKNLSVAKLDDNKTIDQLERYCRNQSTDFGLLTNGVNWLLYETFERNRNKRIVWTIDLEKDSFSSISRKLSQVRHENIATLKEVIKSERLLNDYWDSYFASLEGVIAALSRQIKQEIIKTMPGIKEDYILKFVSEKICCLTNFKSPASKIIAVPVSTEPVTKPLPTPSTSITNTDTNKPPLSVSSSRYSGGTSRNPKSNIKVTFVDGTVIENGKASTTFVETINKIGTQNVKQLNIRSCRVDLISGIKHPKYSQEEVSPECYVFTNTSTKEKISILEYISQQLKLGLKITEI